MNEYVLPGSIVYIDGWKPYESACEFFEQEHWTVNHSKCFKDPITNVHTKTIEGVTMV